MEHEHKTTKELSVPNAIILAGLIIAGAIFLSVGKPSLKNDTVGTGGPAASDTSTPTAPIKIASLSDTDHLQYSGFDSRQQAVAGAKLAIIEYSDLECPYCKVFHPTMQKIMDTYPGKLVWTYRHFPLDSIHSKARAEANAAECAAELGGDTAFWKFVDRIFTITPANNGLDPAKLSTTAAELGLDKAAFNECLTAERFASKVEADFQSGVTAGVNGTPSTFIVARDGSYEQIMGAESFDSVKAKIDKLLTK